MSMNCLHLGHFILTMIAPDANSTLNSLFLQIGHFTVLSWRNSQSSLHSLAFILSMDMVYSQQI